MPRMVYRNYELTGPAVVKIYSQSEMAQALGLTETRLIGALGQGIGLCYHAHPDATGGEYEFNEEAYDKNVRVWTCYRGGGHDYRPDPEYDYLPNGASTCAKCGHTNYH